MSIGGFRSKAFFSAAHSKAQPARTTTINPCESKTPIAPSKDEIELKWLTRGKLYTYLFPIPSLQEWSQDLLLLLCDYVIEQRLFVLAETINGPTMCLSLPSPSHLNGTRWETYPHLPRRLHGFTSIIINSDIHVAGCYPGLEYDNEIRTLQLELVKEKNVDIDTMGSKSKDRFALKGMWKTEIPALPTTRHSTASSLLFTSSGRSQWIITGGLDSQGYDTNQCDALDIASNTWQRYPNLQHSRARHAACVWSGILRVWNGMQLRRPVKHWERKMITSAEEFVDNQWILFPGLPFSKDRCLDICAVPVHSGVILCGGRDEDARMVDHRTWLYQPNDKTYQLLEWSLPTIGHGDCIQVISDDHSNLFAVGVVNHHLRIWFMKASDAVAFSSSTPETILPNSTKWIVSKSTCSLWAHSIQIHLR